MYSLNWTYERQLYNFLDALLACFKHCTNTVSTVISITLWELKTGFQNRAPLNSSSVIRQKLNLKTGFWRKQSNAKFPKKQTFVNPWYAQFFGKFVVFVFLKHPFWDSPFWLYWRVKITKRGNKRGESCQSCTYKLLYSTNMISN